MFGITRIRVVDSCLMLVRKLYCKIIALRTMGEKEEEIDK